MKILETTKFQKLRKKIKETSEKEELKKAIIIILNDPKIGKKLKGELKGLKSLKYFVNGQHRRLIFKIEEDSLFLFSFGPREGVYK